MSEGSGNVVVSGCGAALRRLWAVLLSFVLCGAMLSTVACGAAGAESKPSRAVAGSGQPVAFSFYTPEGKTIRSIDLLGRETLVVFLTTYDNVSLAVTRLLSEFWHRRVPRFNALLVVLEPPQNVDLVAVYRDALGGGLEVTMADSDTFNGAGVFGDMRAVPGIVLLDRDGRVVMRGFGAEAYRQAEALLDGNASHE